MTDSWTMGPEELLNLELLNKEFLLKRRAREKEYFLHLAVEHDKEIHTLIEGAEN